MNFCAVGQCYRRERGQNLSRGSHRDRSRPPPRLSHPPPMRYPPTFTWSYGQGPTRFRERIYISRNRPNFYTSRRRGPENKRKKGKGRKNDPSFLPITGRIERGAGSRESSRVADNPVPPRCESLFKYVHGGSICNIGNRVIRIDGCPRKCLRILCVEFGIRSRKVRKREERERICSGLDACFEFVAVGDRIMKASERRCGGGGGANNQESRILRKISRSYTSPGGLLFVEGPSKKPCMSGQLGDAPIKFSIHGFAGHLDRLAPLRLQKYANARSNESI